MVRLIGRNGRFRGRRALFSNALAARSGSGFLDAVKAELRAQIEFFLEAGVQPRHVTTHLHFHTVPSLSAIVCELARDYHVAWLRNNSLRRAVVPFNVFVTAVQGTVGADPSCLIPSPDYMLALQFWMPYVSPERLAARLLGLEGVIELVIHPCREADPSYPHGIAYAPRRRFREMQYFERLVHCLTTEYPTEFRLAHMGDVR